MYYFIASVCKHRHGQWACQPCQYKSSEAMSLPAFANESWVMSLIVWQAEIWAMSLPALSIWIQWSNEQAEIWAMSLPALSISIQQANITIFQSSLRGNTIMVDMSASRLCVVRVTDRTVCSQCDHELASLVYIVACFNCMCELMCVRIFFKGGFLFEVKCVTQLFYHNESCC